MNKNYTFVLGLFGVAAVTLNQYQDVFAEYPRLAKFLPLATTFVLGVLAYVAHYFNPDGTNAKAPFDPSRPKEPFKGPPTGVGIILILFILVIPIASCDQPTATRRAAQAANDLDLSITTLQSVVEHLNKSAPPLLSNEDYFIILQAERVVVISNKEFRDQIIKSREINLSNKSAYLALLSNISDALSNLQVQGVLRIKSTEAKTRYSLAMAGIRTSIVTLRIFLENVKTPVKIPAGTFR